MDIIIAIAFWIAPLVIAAWVAVHVTEQNAARSRGIITTATIVLVLSLAALTAINVLPVQSDGLFGKAMLFGAWPIAAIGIPLAAGAIVGAVIGRRRSAI